MDEEKVLECTEDWQIRTQKSRTGLGPGRSGSVRVPQRL